MNTRMSYLLLAYCLIVSGCALQEKQPAQERKSPIMTKQAPAPRDASKVLPLLRRFKPELGMEYVIGILGEPGINIGSAVYSHFYPLTDGTSILVQAHINRDHPRKSKYGPVIKIEHGSEVIYDSRK